MNNEFFHFEENKNSDKLVVIFSGVKSKSFMGYKLVKDFNCNKIFIREKNQSWYHSEIRNVSKNIDELIEYIKTFTDKFLNKNITFIGSSMGAYASLLIGIKLNIKKIIAFGPQIIINKNFPNNPKDDSYIKYNNLSSLINSSQSNIDIFIGANELVDLYHVKDIKNKSVNVYKIFGQPHNVMYFLNKLDILKEYIYASVFKKKYELSTLNNFKSNFNMEKYLENGVELFFIKKEYLSAQLIFNKLIQNYPSVNTFWKYSAICSFNQKNYAEAIKLFEQAKLIAFRDDELHYFLGLCHFNLRDYANASIYFKYALEFGIDKKISYFIKLATSLREINKYDEALEILTQSLKVNSTNFGTYYQIYKIYLILDKIPLAIKNLKVAHKLNPNDKIIISELKRLEK